MIGGELTGLPIRCLHPVVETPPKLNCLRWPPHGDHWDPWASVDFPDDIAADGTIVGGAALPNDIASRRATPRRATHRLRALEASRSGTWQVVGDRLNLLIGLFQAAASGSTGSSRTATDSFFGCCRTVRLTPPMEAAAWSS